MNLKTKIDRVLMIEILLVLLITNYMFVTVICNDNFVLKYSRDGILAFLLITVLKNKKQNIIWNKKVIIINIMLFTIMFMFAIFKTGPAQVGLVTFRRYFFPLAFLYLLTKVNLKIQFQRIFRFLVVFFSLLSFAGIFQAVILGDSFLKEIGYPVVYSNYYQREMLYNSYYFGGLGIQRVVATFSSSNSCALALGMTLIFLLVNNECVCVKKKKIRYLIIMAAFVLTYSRSNFLALFMVILCWGFKYIPYKRQIYMSISILGVAIILIGIYQGQNGIFYKLLMWIQSSISFTDSSAAGRSGIWREALLQVLKSPFGIGLGHVGSIAANAGVSNLVFSCENSYLTIALDTGWMGLVGYVSFMLYLFRYLWINSKKYKKVNDIRGYKVCISAAMVIFYLMVVMFFSNHIQNMEIMCLAYLYVAMALSYVSNEKQVMNCYIANGR